MTFRRNGTIVLFISNVSSISVILFSASFRSIGKIIAWSAKAVILVVPGDELLYQKGGGNRLVT